jgi:flavin reductase (DIM6/NTAB) family NADH-FMN oxidoreductase RutF
MTVVVELEKHRTTRAVEEFKTAFRNYPAGVSVITGDPGDGPAGLTATSVISVSADPPVVVFSLSASSSATARLREANTLVVHLLESSHLQLAKTFSTRGIDRFADPTRWGRLRTGEPVLLDASAWLRGFVVERMEVAGSIVVALEVLDAEVMGSEDAGDPLVYHNRTWHRLSEASRLL